MFKFSDIIKNIEHRHRPGQKGTPDGAEAPVGVAELEHPPQDEPPQEETAARSGFEAVADEETDILLQELTGEAAPRSPEPPPPAIEAETPTVVPLVEAAETPIELPGVEPDVLDDVLEETIALEGTADLLEGDPSPPTAAVPSASEENVEALLSEIQDSLDSDSDDISSLGEAPGEPQTGPVPEGDTEITIDDLLGDAPAEAVASGPTSFEESAESGQGAEGAFPDELAALLSDDAEELGAGGADEKSMASAVANIVGDESEDLEEETDAQPGAAEDESSGEDLPQEDLNDLLNEVSDLVKPASDDDRDASMAKTQMNVEEAARILNLDQAEQELAMGEEDLQDKELMQQVRNEASRISDDLDHRRGPEGGGRVPAAAGVALHEEVAPPLTGLWQVVARVLGVLNWPFERLHVAEQTRNTIGYAAVLITLVLLAVLLVVMSLAFIIRLS